MCCQYMNITPLRFYLARHGESVWNQQGRLQGQLDSPLTEAGRRQAAELGRLLQSKSIDLIASSTLGRARESAEICQPYLNCEIRVLPGLEERHFGEWQGQSMALVKQLPQYPKVCGTLSRKVPFGGESSIASAKRLHQSLMTIAEQCNDSTVLVVSHGDIIANFVQSFLLGEDSERPSLLKHGDWLTLECDRSRGLLSLLE